MGSSNLSGVDSTAPGYEQFGDEEFSIGSVRGGRRAEPNGWTAWGTIGTWAAIAMTLIGALLYLGWHVSKADSALNSVQVEVKDTRTEVRDVKVKVDKLVDETATQGRQLERIEKSMSQVQDGMRDMKPNQTASPVGR